MGVRDVDRVVCLVWQCGDHRTRSSVGHAQQKRLLVLELEVLIVKLFTVDALSTSAIASGEITTLDHKRLDDSVEGGALVVKRDAGLALALFSSAESPEVLGSLWDNVIVLLEVSN